MRRSIEETKKLFTIEGLDKGQVQVKTTQYLLSLPEERQIQVLSAQLDRLKKDFEGYDTPAYQGTKTRNAEMEKMQLQVLIQVIEGQLDQI